VSAKHELDRSTRRVEELVFALDGLADPAAASSARELVQLVLELHGTALGRMMEKVAADAVGRRVAASFAEDECISGVLLLHGLHPLDFEARIQAAVARLHPHLGVQGIVVEDLRIEGDRVNVRLQTGDAGHHADSDAEVIRREVRQALFDAAPDASSVDVSGPPAQAVFVPVSSITVRRRAEDAADAPH
jgi:hypothetical protein